jgi:hypothetical protein
VGDYDLILDAPFPKIEVIRYAANGRKAATGGSDNENWHWFSFDNRRLYCYQRVAVELWPNRVAVPVEILYADMGTIRKKLDSVSCGISVSIGHAFETNPIEWSWRDNVKYESGSEHANAMAVVVVDDGRTSVDELLDAVVEPASLTALSRGLAPEPSAGEAFTSLNMDGLCGVIAAALAEGTNKKSVEPVDTEGSSAPTVAPESMSGESVSGRQTPQGSTSSNSEEPNSLDVATALAGTWQGHKGETYTVSCVGASWQCVRHETYSTKRFTMIYDCDKNIVWWGIQRAYFFCVSDLFEHPAQLKWYTGKDSQKKRAVFSWYKVNEEEQWQEHQTQKSWTQWKRKPSGYDAYNYNSGHQQWQKRTSENKSSHSKWVAVATTGGA